MVAPVTPRTSKPKLRLARPVFWWMPVSLAGVWKNTWRASAGALGDVEAVFLTHGHGDHTAGVRSLVRQFGLPVFAAPGVAESVGARLVEEGETLDLGGLSTMFFKVPHDTATYGLHISDGERASVVATDLGEVLPEVMRRMRGADAVVLEANHDTDWLWRGPYPADLKRRVSSATGHLSNQQAAEVALDLAPHGLKDLVLAHLSEKNNSPARACGVVHKALREAGYNGLRVRSALARRPTPWIEVGYPLDSPEYLYRYASEDRAEVTGQLFEME